MAFTGQLNVNRVITSLFNMIISIDTNSKNISSSFAKLMEENRTDGSRYGDTKLKLSVDCLGTIKFTGDDQSNILENHRPKPPHTQALVMDVFRQIPLTTGGDFFDKQAFLSEGSYVEFISVVTDMITKTKQIYEGTTFNTFIGTHKSAKQKTIEIDPTQYPTLAQGLSTTLANLFDDIQEPTRSFNEINFLRAWDESDLEIIINKSYYNQFRYNEVPDIFHEEEIKSMLKRGGLHQHYFGDIITTPGTATGTQRTMVEGDFKGTVGDSEHLFPGDLLPNGAAYKANEAYTEDDNILCIVTRKGFCPFMAAATREAQWLNPRNGNLQHYLNFGHNTLQIIDDAPWVIIKKKAA